MEIILVKRIASLGKLGDKVNVKSGYGRNYLIPQGFAVSATAANIAAFEARRAEMEREEAEALAAANARAEQLKGLQILIRSKAGDEGKLFGSIGTRDISDAIAALGQTVDKAEIRLHNGPLRHTGEFTIDIALHHDLVIELPITIESE